MLSKLNSFEPYLEDTGEARVKLATANEISKFCDGLVPDPAYMYLHVIAMGAGDYYGCNKNGDYFPEKSLILYHHTFEQNAKIFKEHNNKSTSPNFGNVVKSWYNPDMHRVELILAVDKAKAPDIVAKVERGEVPEVSMGARVPHDVCSICGNKASKKSEYCDHIRKELKHVYPDGRQVYMLNLQPTFFDISFVFRRADKLGLMLKKVASIHGNLEHVYDVEDEDSNEKLAEMTKEVNAEAVIRVLERGMANILPKLEASEPDLSPALLDRIASKYTLKDIFHSFLNNYVPLKPKEVSRIIIIQTGMPVSAQDQVLRGIEQAIPERAYPGGEMQSEIASLLQPMLSLRSSLGPHIVHRVLALRGMGKLASLQNSNYQANLNMGSGHKYDYSTIPVMYNEDAYNARQYELANRSLRKPVNPFAVGLALGAMYLAYRGVNGLQSAVNTLKSDKVMLGASAATIAAVMALHGNKREKVAADGNFMQSTAMTHFVAPYVGVHLASAHYRNKFMRGEDLNAVQKYIAENPDYLSLAAPVLIHLGTKKVNSFKAGPTKIASDRELEKIADFADSLAQGAITGIIYRGRNASPMASITGALLDTPMYSSVASNMPAKKVPAQPLYRQRDLETHQER